MKIQVFDKEFVNNKNLYQIFWKKSNWNFGEIQLTKLIA